MKILNSAILILIMACTLACDSSSGSGSSSPTIDQSLDVSKFPNVSATIYGRWVVNQSVHDNGWTFITRIYVNKNNQIGLSLECNSEISMDANATVLGRIGDDTFEILQDGNVTTSKTIDGRDFKCGLQIKRVKYLYTVSGDSLTLKDLVTNREESYRRM